jgi:FtsP/CotA-like multicopper oxidase with cupredoxin domain
MAPTRADHTIHIVPTSLEIAPGRVIKTTAYNGSVPGPLLTLKEGKAFTIDVVNASRYPNLIHWHGLFISSPQDGSIEEGAAIIPDGGSLRYTYIPRPSGTRWYHSHAIAMSDLRRSTYSAA